MGTLSLTNPSNGTTTDANVIANNNDAIEACVNGGLDNANISGSAGIGVTKLAAGTDGTNLVVVNGVPTWRSPIATTISGLSTAEDGFRARLRVGSSPYEFVDLVYDGTYGKWVSPPTFWLTGSISNEVGTDTRWSSAGSGSGTGDIYVQNMKAIYDTGLRLQVMCSGKGAGTAVTWNYKVGCYQFNQGDTSDASLGATSSLISGTAANERKASGWVDFSITAPSETHGILAAIFTYSSNSNTTTVTFGYRWVA
jgi:hypothetical protein